MKFCVLALTVSAASAFAPAPSATKTMALNAEGDEMSKAIPFVARPKSLDGSMPGDVGFDPFGFAGEDTTSLMNMREAEIKHGVSLCFAASLHLQHVL
jgi:hypothetical protein